MCRPSPAPDDRSISAAPNGLALTDICDILAIGFGTAVAMWAVGYVGHMPLTHIPPVVFLSMMLVCMGIGGWCVGRYTRRGVWGAVWIGVVSSAINLLILGSLLRQPLGGQLVPQVGLWLPGAFAMSILLAVVGLIVARMGRAASYSGEVNWAAALAWVTCVAGLLLLIAGGLVTGFRAGLAVPDWPNTYGSNMFLFPFTLMTGGVFYEHAHRLLGTLVGLLTLTLAIYLTAALRHRKMLTILVWIVGVCVVAQGVVGGVRVTDDSHELAVVHGFFAHAILGALVAIAVMLSRHWQLGVGTQRRSPIHTDRFLTIALVGLILLQTLLGTLVRQLDAFLLTHISAAVIVVLAGVGAGDNEPGASIPTRRCYAAWDSLSCSWCCCKFNSGSCRSSSHAAGEYIAFGRRIAGQQRQLTRTTAARHHDHDSPNHSGGTSRHCRCAGAADMALVRRRGNGHGR